VPVAIVEVHHRAALVQEVRVAASQPDGLHALNDRAPDRHDGGAAGRANLPGPPPHKTSNAPSSNSSTPARREGSVVGDRVGGGRRAVDQESVRGA
jgi:hypothetical protein